MEIANPTEKPRFLVVTVQTADLLNFSRADG